jgi:hypothetical protein
VTIYSNFGEIQTGAYPAILAIGDSWFWYPKVPNLLEGISAVVKPVYSNVLAFGNIGATLESYLKGKYARDFATALRPADATYSAVMISGGGNDVVDWKLCLKQDCGGATQAADCVDPAALANAMTDLTANLLAMISEVHQAYDAARRTRPDIFVHCYDYPPPDGRGFELPLFGIKLLGPWLKPAMDACNVPSDPGLRQDVMRLLMDGLSDAFTQFDSPRDGVYVVQSLGTLDPATDWDNELHPTGRGFQKLVHEPWLDSLRAAGYAK